jgi:hypothetical protein
MLVEPSALAWKKNAAVSMYFATGRPPVRSTRFP